MKILIWHEHQTAPGEGGGGAESMLRDQTEALKRLDHEVAWLQSAHIEQAVKAFQPDIVQVQTIHNAFGVEPIKWLQDNDIPHVWALMDYWPFCGGRMLLKGNEACAAVNGKCDQFCEHPKAPAHYLPTVNKSPIVALNEYTAEIYRRNGMRVDHVLELGIDTDMFAPDYSMRPEAVTVYASSAWPEYPQKGFPILKEAINGLPVNVNLMAHVPREKIAEGLKKAHIYVFPSCYEETWGLCLNEAMASGCACIATDVAGAKAQIQDGITGLIVPKHNATALRWAIRWLMEDTELRESLGRNARAHVEVEHSLDALGKRWESLYAKVLHMEAINVA
jgi:glycosyltransferase involved in cell wall biosynthesis